MDGGPASTYCKWRGRMHTWMEKDKDVYKRQPIASVVSAKKRRHQTGYIQKYQQYFECKTNKERSTEDVVRVELKKL